MRTPHLAWLLVAVAPLTGCGKRVEGCDYTGTCPVQDTSSSSGGTSAGGSTGTGGGSTDGGAGGSTTTSTTSVSSSTSQGGTGGTAGEGGSGGSGGVGGSSGAAGAAGSPPCDGACEGATPVCDKASDACVECVETDDCEDGVCDPEAQWCVECLGSEDCADPTPLCDVERQFCVECLGATDCTDPQASLCDAGSCAPCQTNADCAHLADTTVCDDGACVECTVADEAVCGGKSCNPATNTCTETDVASVGNCEPCVADSECSGSNQSEPVRRCIPMEFNGELRPNAYCLKRQSAGCSPPYGVVITRSSLSGASEEAYCGIDQQNVTCEAVLDLLASQTCPSGEDTECGCPRDQDDNCTATGQGGLCRTVGAFDKQCTYQCGVNNACPQETTCSDQDPDFCQ